jgi:hypothetical protein
MCDGDTCTPKMKKALDKLFDDMDDIAKDIEN